MRRDVTVRQRELARKLISRRLRIAKHVTDRTTNREQKPDVQLRKDVTEAPHQSDGRLASTCGRKDGKDVMDFRSERMQKMSRTRGQSCHLYSGLEQSLFLQKMSQDQMLLWPDPTLRFLQKMSRTARSQGDWHFACSSAKTAPDVTATISAEPKVPIQPHCINSSRTDGICRGFQWRETPAA